MMLYTSIYVEGHGRRWTVWATTIPAGGTRVEVWRRRSKRSALRKAERVRRSIEAREGIVPERIEIR